MRLSARIVGSSISSEWSRYPVWKMSEEAQTVTLVGL
jgi:hypothetical protein